MIPFSWICLWLATLTLHPGVARADNDSSNSKCNGEIKISSQSDADALSSCDSIQGTLIIAPSATGTISIPKVEEIKGPLTIKDADGLNAVKADELESVSGPVTVENNKALTSLQFDELGSIGGELKIKGNKQLREVKLDDLEQVNGGVSVEGGFTGLSLSNLETVRGPTNIASSARNFSCSALDDLRSQGAFGSDFKCSNDSSSSSDNDKDKDDNNSNSGGGLSAGAKAGIAVGVVVGVALVLLAVWFCIRRHRRQRVAQKEALAALDGGGTGAGAAAGINARGQVGDEEKGESNHTTTTTSSVSPVSPDDPSVNALAIPRKPLSPAPQETGVVSLGTSSNGNGNTNGTSGSTSLPSSLPSSLVVGDNRFSTVSALGTSESDALFLRSGARRAPSESDVPMLDSGDVHEAPAQSAREVDPPFELDAGPVRGTHQQAINHE